MSQIRLFNKGYLIFRGVTEYINARHISGLAFDFWLIRGEEVECEG